MSILVTSPCTETQIQELGIKNWPIWTCDVSSFDWTYEDQETCLLLEGEVTVTPEGGDACAIWSRGFSCLSSRYGLSMGCLEGRA